MLVIHGLDLRRSGALPGFLSSLATLLLLLGALTFVRRRELSVATANGLHAGFAALVLGNVALHYFTARDPSVAAMFIFYCLGVGGVLYHRAALLGLLLLAYGSWLGATLIAVPHANALRDGLTIATSTGLGYVLYLARMRAILHTDKLRREAERRRTAAEEALLAVQRLQKSLVEVVGQTPEGMVVHRQGRVLFANRSFADLFLLGPAEGLIGTQLAMLMQLDEPAELSKPMPPRELRSRRRDGAAVMLEVGSTELEWEQQPAILLSVRDVTVRHSATEARLAQADKLLSLGRLAASAAHEINNPLSYVIGNLNELERKGLSEDSRRLVDDATQGAQRVRAIVTSLTAFARSERATSHSSSLTLCMEAALTAVSQELTGLAQLEIKRRFESELCVNADPPIIEQLFVKLLSNAAHALRGRVGAQLSLSIEELEGQAQVTVADNGAGMSAAVQKRLFEPFFSTKSVGEGTGLGLFYAHSVVQNLGGTLSVVSAPDRGTTFTVRLPMSRSSVTDAPAPRTDAPEAPPIGRDVLIIDDDALVARSLARRLREHSVEIADSGERGLERMRQRSFDCVLCDLMMPGLDGPGVHARAVLLGQAHKLIFVTGGAFTPAGEQFLASVKNPVLSKPVDLKALRQTIEEVARLKNQPPKERADRATLEG
jgi:PAS domain S-box-containing protein